MKRAQLTAEEIVALQQLLQQHGIHVDLSRVETAEHFENALHRHGLRSTSVYAIEMLTDILLFLETYGIRPRGILEKLFRRLLHQLETAELNRYTIRVTQEKHTMAIGNIAAGTTGTFAAALQDNGATIPLPSGSTFVWSADDTNASLSPSSDTTSLVVNIPTTDQSTSITITASTTAPDGTTATGQITVPLTPGSSEPQKFTVSITQTA